MEYIIGTRAPIVTVICVDNAYLCIPNACQSDCCSYYKTGSLMANSCKAIAMVGSYPDYVCSAAFRYGLHVGE